MYTYICFNFLFKTFIVTAFWTKKLDKTLFLMLINFKSHDFVWLFKLYNGIGKIRQKTKPKTKRATHPFNIKLS